jgi:hypothetical protein
MTSLRLASWAPLVFTCFLMTACGADVQVADDDGRAGASSEGGSTSGPGGGGGPPTYDLQAGCAAVCDQPCVGSPTLCTEYCVEAVAHGCERESVERYACGMDYCVGEQDCTAEQDAVFACKRRGGCEDPVAGSFNAPVCESASGSACDEYGCDPISACECSAPCDDGHSATVSCDVDWEDYDESWNSPRFDCRCFFDGELVGECSVHYPTACLVETSCCQGWFAVD